MLGADLGLSDQQVIIVSHILQPPVSCLGKGLTTLSSSYNALSVSCSYSQLKDSLCLGPHRVTQQNSGCQTLKPTHPLLLLSIFGGFSTSNKETSTIPGVTIINSHQCRQFVLLITPNCYSTLLTIYLLPPRFPKVIPSSLYP